MRFPPSLLGALALGLTSSAALARNLSEANPALFSLHRGLMNQVSITGNETAATDWLAAHLRGLGWTVELQRVFNRDIDPEDQVRRENIFAYLGGKRDVTLVVNAHVDVVPPYIPYSDDDTTVYGRGANDDKGCIAAQITAVELLRKQGKIGEGDVGLLYTVGEEGLFDGMAAAQELGFSPRWAVVGEPTQLKQINGHKGKIDIEVRSTGVAAHSSTPWLGRNAIDQLARVIVQLSHIELPTDELLGPTTLATTIVRGGAAHNQVPDSATALVNVRPSVPAEEVWEVIAAAGLNSSEVQLVQKRQNYDPVKLETVANWRPVEPMTVGTDYFSWTLPSARLLIGPGSVATAHKLDEQILKQDLLDGVDVYAELFAGLLDGTLRIEGEKEDARERDEL